MNQSNLSTEEEKELFERIREGDQQALESLMEAYVGYVRWILRYTRTLYLSDHEDKRVNELQKPECEDDLYQAGCLALLKAIQKYDPNRGAKFSTYAYKWIQRGVENEIKFQLNRLGIKGDNGFESKKSISLSEEEYIVEMIPDDGETALDILIDREENDDQMKEVARKMLSLTKEERTVLFMVYGIDGERVTNHKRIGNELGMTEIQVRIIYETAMKKING